MNHYDEFFKEQYERIQKKLDLITANLMFNQHFPNDPFIDNSKFIELMGISAKTALSWRESGLIDFVQINNKIYYRISSINDLLDKNTRKSTKSL